VIIETPDHNRPAADMSAAEIAMVFKAWRERLIDLRRDIRIRYVLFFKNHGREAGASLYHPHSQLIATPIIPTAVVEELNVAREHWGRKERCIFCDLIRQEKALGDRVALETDRFVLLEPFAASFPFETWLMPKDHCHDFALCTDQLLEDLAKLVRDFLRRIRRLLDDPPYNFILHTAPSPHPRPGQPRYWTTIEYDYHWHLEFVRGSHASPDSSGVRLQHQPDAAGGGGPFPARGRNGRQLTVGNGAPTVRRPVLRRRPRERASAVPSPWPVSSLP